MANNLKEMLKEKHSGLSPLMKEREKLDTEAALTYDCLTLSKVHLVSDSDGGMYAVVVFKECPDKFYFGGVVLTEIVIDLYKFIGQDFSEVLDVEDENIELIVTERKSKTRKTKYFDWSIK